MSQGIAETAKIKKTLFTSNIVLASIVYFAYIEYCSRLRKQEQIQRHKRDAEQSRLSEITRRKHVHNGMWGKLCVELDPERKKRVTHWTMGRDRLE